MLLVELGAEDNGHMESTKILAMTCIIIFTEFKDNEILAISVGHELVNCNVNSEAMTSMKDVNTLKLAEEQNTGKAM